MKNGWLEKMKLSGKKIFLIGSLGLCLLLGGFYAFALYPNHEVPILTYHRFGDDPGTLFVSPANFERQMAYLKNKGYDVISLDELVEGIKAGRSFKHNTVAITIDDGYKDNFLYAYPVLKKYSFPATIFLIANHVGAKDGFMDWDDARRMAHNGIAIGGHTKNHPYLSSIKDPDVLWDEIAGCKRLIEDKLGEPVEYYCYPMGSFTEKAKAMVRRAGYKGACTTNKGSAAQSEDVYELKRIKITNSDTNKPFGFWAKLSGYYNFFRSKKSPQ